MKYAIVLLFSACFITSYCTAQAPVRPQNPVRITQTPPIRTKGVDVIFLSTDTCNLSINGKNYGEIVKSKTVRLPLGNYSFLFESLETGKTIKNRSFRLTRDSLTGGAYSYPITFE